MNSILFLLFMLAACRKEEQSSVSTLDVSAGPDRTAYLFSDTIQLRGFVKPFPSGLDYSIVWKQVSGPSQVEWIESAGMPGVCSSLEEGSYVFSVEAFHVFMGLYDRDTVSISVLNPFLDNVAPMADAGPDIEMMGLRQLVSLSAAGSSDPDQQPMVYSWRWMDINPQDAQLYEEDSSRILIAVLEKPRMYHFELTVTDHKGLQDRDTVRVQLRELAGSRWSKLDLPSDFPHLKMMIADNAGGFYYFPGPDLFGTSFNHWRYPDGQILRKKNFPGSYVSALTGFMQDGRIFAGLDFFDEYNNGQSFGFLYEYEPAQDQWRKVPQLLEFSSVIRALPTQYGT